MRQALGLFPKPVHTAYDVFRVSSVLGDIKLPIDFVAIGESRHVRTGLFHHSRDVPAQNERQLMRYEGLQIARAYLPIDGIDPSCSYAHENFVCACRRLRYLLKFKDIRVSK